MTPEPLKHVRCIASSAALLAMAALLASACGPAQPNPGSGNQDGGPGDAATTPTSQVTANAGPDQTVDDGASVTLTGRGTDSGGAAITYAWAQAAGPDVTLTGYDQPTATFLAPPLSTTLTFELKASSTTGSATDEVTVTVAAAPILLVVNRGGNSIVRFRAAKDLDGDVAPLGSIAGPNARLNGPASIQLDRIGGALVTNADGNRVSGFLNIMTANGDVTPERYVGGPASLLNDPEGLAYSLGNDLAFVGNFDSGPGSVNVYSNVSTSAFIGTVAPVRQIRSFGINDCRALVLAGTDELYVVNTGSNNVSVFANASSVQGFVSPSRTITSTELQDHVLADAIVDTENHLLVLESTGNRVLVFSNAPALGEDAKPDAILTIPGATSVAGMQVDSSGTGYITDSGRAAVYIYDNIVQRNGSLAPDRTLAGAKTQLASPWHMALIPR
jgi:hypothetical protein